MLPSLFGCCAVLVGFVSYNTHSDDGDYWCDLMLSLDWVLCLTSNARALQR
jgi:hypothetical protein